MKTLKIAPQKCQKLINNQEDKIFFYFYEHGEEQSYLEVAEGLNDSENLSDSDLDYENFKEDTYYLIY